MLPRVFLTMCTESESSRSPRNHSGFYMVLTLSGSFYVNQCATRNIFR